MKSRNQICQKKCQLTQKRVNGRKATNSFLHRISLLEIHWKEGELKISCSKLCVTTEDRSPNTWPKKQVS